jgi:hypothetical protein
VLRVRMQLGLMLMLELCAEFVFGWGPGAGPGYGDRGRGCRRGSQLVKYGGSQAAGSAGEESQDQGRHVGVAGAYRVKPRRSSLQECSGW